MAMQPISQLLPLQTRWHPGQLAPAAIRRGRHRQHRHLQVVAGQQRRIGIDITAEQLRSRLQLAQPLLQSLAETAADAGEQQQGSHQSGTGSQPQGVKG